MKFTKMEGIGNDYVYVNDLDCKLNDLNAISKKVSDRHFGIGSDGLIVVRPSDNADFFMRMFNADGSEGKMCGNGIRCFSKFVYDEGLTTKSHLEIETLSGIKYIDLTFDDNGEVIGARVDMGEPILNAVDVPMHYDAQQVINQPLDVNGQTYYMTAVSMGNPHAVTYMENIDELDLVKMGPSFEYHVAFPESVNTEFVKLVDRHRVSMRVWERGSGETLACGTGACAVAVASILNGHTERAVTVELLGGELLIEWDEATNRIFMTGPATTVFTGEINLGGLE